MVSLPSEFDIQAARNLLIGALGVQLEFYTIDELVDVLKVWSDQPSQPLATILLEQKLVSAAVKDLLCALSAKHVELHDGDVTESLQALSSVRELQSRLKTIKRDAIQSALAATITNPSVSQPTATFLPAQAMDSERGSFGTSSLTPGQQRFRVIRPHAKGGLGEVFLANDVELDREVALKEIQEQFADHEESRLRFRLEAQVTGKLEHPGIVPVYGCGQYDDGRPFYAMRFIRGDSLKDAIKAFHAKADKSSSNRYAEDGLLEFRKLLRRFVDICNAIEYAHSRGILHRDLKPGNVILGNYGETLVVDWGLAKPIGAATSQTQENGPIHMSEGSGVSQTMAGTILGTPAFMSPEQAAGKIERLGPATDIYSLGATLYELLTNKPPISGKSTQEVIDNVIKGEFRRPAELNRLVPKPLEAICLRAMSLDPDHRYASPLRLAEDIERWLADERVQAYSETVIERAVRFVRKHRAWALSAAIALVVTAAIATGAAIFINQAKLDTEVALKKESEALKSESEQRSLASNRMVEAQKNSYLANIRLADSAWNSSLARTSNQALENCIPVSTEADYRNWEWQYQRNRNDHCWLNLQIGSFPYRNPEQWTQFGIFGIALSPDSTRIAVTKGGDLEIRNAVSGELLQKVTAFKPNPVNLLERVVFSGDGQHVFAAGGTSVFCWNAITGTPVREYLSAQALRVFDLAVSPDQTRLIATAADGSLAQWEIASGKVLDSFPSPGSPSRCVAFSRDGRFLISGHDDGSIHIWDPTTNKEIRSFGMRKGVHARGRELMVLSVAIDPAKNRAYAGLSDSTIEVWDFESGNRIAKWPSHTDFVTCLKMTAAGDQIISGSVDQSIVITNADTGLVRRRILGHDDRVVSLDLSSDERRIASVSLDGNIRISDFRIEPACRIIPTASNLNYRIRASPDGRFIAWSDQYRTRAFDAQTNQILIQSDGPQGRLKFSNDGNRVLINGSVWDMTTRQVLHEFYKPPQDYRDIHARDLSDDGRLFAAVENQQIIFSDSATGEEIDRSPQAPFPIKEIVFSGEKNHLYCLGDGIARWNPDTKTFDVQWDVPADTSGLALCANRQLVATMHPNGSIFIWDSSTGTSKGQLDGHRQQVTDVGFNLDGSRLVSSSMDAMIKVWDMNTFEEVCTLRGHQSSVFGVCFTHDGNQLLSAGWDQTVRRWQGSSDAVRSKSHWKASSTAEFAMYRFGEPPLWEERRAIVENDHFLTEEEKKIAVSLIGPLPPLLDQATTAFRTRNLKRLDEITNLAKQQEPPDSLILRKVLHLARLLKPQELQILKDLPTEQTVARVADLRMEVDAVGWGPPLRNQRLDEAGSPPFLEVDGKYFESGLWAHPPSRHSLRLNSGWKTLKSQFGLGLKDEGSVVFVVLGDGKELFRSELIHDNMVHDLSISIENVDLLELLVEDGGNGAFRDWALWLNPELHR